MDRLVYTSLSAMRGSMARQAANANNIANINTVGFRGEYSAASAMYVRGETQPARAHASEEVVGADMRSGTVNVTGRDLDVAMNGDALLGVQSLEGEEAYTRRGDLSVADTGLLTNGEGLPVLGEEGPITVPPYDSIKIEPDGVVRIVPMGGNPEQPQISRPPQDCFPGRIERREGHGRPVPGQGRRRAAGRSGRQDPARQPGRLERRGEPRAGRDDRGQPRLGHADQAHHHRARARQLGRGPHAPARLMGFLPLTSRSS
jgi:hypothetical protein